MKIWTGREGADGFGMRAGKQRAAISSPRHGTCPAPARAQRAHRPKACASSCKRSVSVVKRAICRSSTSAASRRVCGSSAVRSSSSATAMAPTGLRRSWSSERASKASFSCSTSFAARACRPAAPMEAEYRAQTSAPSAAPPAHSSQPARPRASPSLTVLFMPGSLEQCARVVCPAPTARFAARLPALRGVSSDLNAFVFLFPQRQAHTGLARALRCTLPRPRRLLALPSQRPCSCACP